MVRLLVLDMLRRVAYWPLALLAFGFALAWGLFPASGGAAPVMAMSLAAICISGPVAMIGWLGTPVVSYLPVSRRDVWRAAWIMGTLAPAALMTALKVPGTIAGGVAGWSTLALSSLLDLLYAGAGCVLLVRTNPEWATGSAGAGMLRVLLLFVGGIFFPFAIQRGLPTEWAALTRVHILALAVAVALTARSASYSPQGSWPRRQRAAATPPGSVVFPAASGRLSGLPRLLVHELVWSGGMAITLFVSFLAVALFASSLSGSFKTFELFAASQRLFVFNPASFTRIDQDLHVFGLLGWYALFVAAVSARFPEALRHLRALPLGSAAVHTLLMGWPVLVWTAIWALLMVLHLGSAQPITTFQVPLWLTLVAMSQLTQALRLRVSERWFPIVFMGIPFARAVDSVPGWMLVAVWAIATVAALALNVSALSRNQTYKHTNALALRMQRMS